MTFVQFCWKLPLPKDFPSGFCKLSACIDTRVGLIPLIACGRFVLTNNFDDSNDANFRPFFCQWYPRFLQHRAVPDGMLSPPCRTARIPLDVIEMSFCGEWIPFGNKAENRERAFHDSNWSYTAKQDKTYGTLINMYFTIRINCKYSARKLK